MRFVVLLCGLLAVPTAGAETIFRCVGKGGKVTLQSDECPIEQKQTWKYYPRPNDTGDAARRRERIEAEMDQRNRQGSNNGQVIHNYGSTSQRDQKRAQCNAARQSRESVLRQVGTRRNFNLLRQLDDRVNRACVGL
jgi:hypothetical protein